MPTPIKLSNNDTESSGSAVSGDTFEFADPDEHTNKGSHLEDIDIMLIDGLRDFLFPAGTDGAESDAAKDDAIFDNLVDFYQIPDATGGVNSAPDDDVVA